MTEKKKLPATKRSRNAIKNLGADKEVSIPTRTCTSCQGKRKPQCLCGGKGYVDVRLI